MPKMLNDVCGYLTNECNHQDLWIDWRAWPAGPIPSHLTEQPIIISSSGRDLADYDGTFWYFINSYGYLQFDAQVDFSDPLVTRNPPLDTQQIKLLEDFVL